MKLGMDGDRSYQPANQQLHVHGQYPNGPHTMEIQHLLKSKGFQVQAYTNPSRKLGGNLFSVKGIERVTAINSQP